MLAKMKTLDEATLTKEFRRELTKDEIQGLLARRDLIVKLFEAKGDSALFDRPQQELEANAFETTAALSGSPGASANCPAPGRLRI